MIAHSDSSYRQCSGCNLTAARSCDCNLCGRKNFIIISDDLTESNFIKESTLTDNLIVNQETIDKDDYYENIPIEGAEEPSKYVKETAFEKKLRKQAYKAIQRKHGRK